MADACQRETLELRGDVAAGRQDAVTALRQRATCPGLDFDPAAREIASAACDAATAGVAQADGRDEGALRRLANDDRLCAGARTAAAQRLTSLQEARAADDRTCEEAINLAVGAKDLARLQNLAANGSCERRKTAIAMQVDDLRRAEREAVAEARCGAAQVLAARDRDDRACEAAVRRGDLDTLQQLATDRLCARRQSLVLAKLGALRGAQRQRIVAAQRKLIQVGCYSGPETGLLDAATLRGVADYWAATRRDQPAPTTISLDLSSELDGTRALSAGWCRSPVPPAGDAGGPVLKPT